MSSVTRTDPATSIATIGGTPDAFYDGTHMKVPNLRLMLDAVIARDPRLD